MLDIQLIIEGGNGTIIERYTSKHWQGSAIVKIHRTVVRVLGIFTRWFAQDFSPLFSAQRTFTALLFLVRLTACTYLLIHLLACFGAHVAHTSSRTGPSSPETCEFSIYSDWNRRSHFIAPHMWNLHFLFHQSVELLIALAVVPTYLFSANGYFCLFAELASTAILYLSLGALDSGVPIYFARAQNIIVSHVFFVWLHWPGFRSFAALLQTSLVWRKVIWPEVYLQPIA